MNDYNQTNFFNPAPKPEPERFDIEDNDDPTFRKKKAPPAFKNLRNIRERALLEKAFAACHTGRRNFGDRNERTMWNRIERELGDGRIPRAWVNHCIAWGDSKNKEMIQIIFKNILTYILNAEKMADFMAKKKFADFMNSGEIKEGVVEIEQDDGRTIELE